MIWFDSWGAPEPMKSDDQDSDEEASYEEPEVEPEPSLELPPDASMEAEAPSAAPAMRWHDWDPEASEPELTEPTADPTVDSGPSEVYSEDDLFRWPTDEVTDENDEEESTPSLDSIDVWPPTTRPVEPPGWW